MPRSDSSRSRSGSPSDEKVQDHSPVRRKSPAGAAPARKARVQSRSRSGSPEPKRSKRSRSGSPPPQKRRRPPTGRSRTPSRSRSRSHSRSRSGDEEEDGHRIHIGDLGIDCSKSEIEREFKKFGPLLEVVWLARHPPCFAFIVYKHRKDAEDAIAELNGAVLCGSRVRVSWARPRTRGRRGHYDPSMRCYQCGEAGHFSRNCRGGGGSGGGGGGGRGRDGYRGRGGGGGGYNDRSYGERNDDYGDRRGYMKQRRSR